MLTRIPKIEIQKGMFIEAVECPAALFGKRRFVLDCDIDLNAIIKSPAKFVLINTAIGADRTEKAISAPLPSVLEPLRPTEARAQATATMTRSLKILKAELTTMVTGGAFDMGNVMALAEEITKEDAATFRLFFEITRLKQKDETTFQHSLSVGILMGRLADALDLDSKNVELLAVCGWLHDIGKMTIPNNILQKEGPLTAAERKLVQSHPRRGHQILKRFPNIPNEALEICLHHHEALDGSGYPTGISGSKISPLVRISTVCDVFDALTSARPYKRGWTTSDALAWMFEQDHRFDRKLVLRLGAFLGA